MKIFFDTEFTGLHQQTTLISIGLVSEDGRNFYAECYDYDPAQLNPWIAENVLAHLQFTDPAMQDKTWGDRASFRACCSVRDLPGMLRVWLHQFLAVEMWGDCCAYDWVLFCELFGGALSLPGQVSIYPRDLAMLLEQAGLDIDLGRRTFAGRIGAAQHHALADARVIQGCYQQALAYRDGNQEEEEDG